MAIQLVYETHSITTDNEAGIATGWLPGVLSERGVESARELGRRRRDDGIEAVYASDLARAVETARIAFEASQIPVHLESRLRECNYGRLNGMPAIEHAPQRGGHIAMPWPGGESYLDVVARTRSFLEDLARRHRDRARVLVIAHSANHWALEHLLNGADLASLVKGGMRWQPGWEFEVPVSWGSPPGE